MIRFTCGRCVRNGQKSSTRWSSSAKSTLRKVLFCYLTLCPREATLRLGLPNEHGTLSYSYQQAKYNSARNLKPRWISVLSKHVLWGNFPAENSKLPQRYCAQIVFYHYWPSTNLTFLLVFTYSFANLFQSYVHFSWFTTQVQRHLHTNDWNININVIYALCILYYLNRSALDMIHDVILHIKHAV